MSNSSTQEGKRPPPIHEIKLGSIKGLIWKNETKKGPRLSATYERVYMDDKEEWQVSNSYGPTDSLVLAQVTRLCALWMFKNQAKVTEEDEIS